VSQKRPRTRYAKGKSSKQAERPWVYWPTVPRYVLWFFNLPTALVLGVVLLASVMVGVTNTFGGDMLVAAVAGAVAVGTGATVYGLIYADWKYSYTGDWVDELLALNTAYKRLDPDLRLGIEAAWHDVWRCVEVARKHDTDIPYDVVSAAKQITRTCDDLRQAAAEQPSEALKASLAAMHAHVKTVNELTRTAQQNELENVTHRASEQYKQYLDNGTAAEDAARSDESWSAEAVKAFAERERRAERDRQLAIERVTPARRRNGHSNRCRCRDCDYRTSWEQSRKYPHSSGR